jgi:prevent-host-death family protein
MVTVTVTELNQQTAKVLDRVKNGESLEIKEHGRSIARLVPFVAASSMTEQLVSEGRAIAASKPNTLFTSVRAAPRGAPSLGDDVRNARDGDRF